MKESDLKNRKLAVPVLLWIRLLISLRLRGKGCRESGAFLLGVRVGNVDRVKRFVCYDDLDPRSLDTGIVVFKGNGFSKLWGICRASHLTVLADIHTHGGQVTRQSEADRTNPMVCERGHIAIIAPYFARTLGWKMRGFSVYEYDGDYSWKDWSSSNRTERVQFSIF